MLTQTDIQAALQIAAFAVVFSDLLTRPKMLFESYGKWLDRMEMTRPKLAYPLGYCSKCLAGQLALWVFVFIADGCPVLMPVRWVGFISVTILLAAILSAALAKLSR